MPHTSLQCVVIDTNVISYLFKGDSRGTLYRQQLMTGKTWVISFMTLAELDAWAIRRQWGEPKQSALKAFLSNFVVVPYDRSLCQQWAQVTEEARQAGRPISCSDGWIAATSMLYRMPLVTHNPKDFGGITQIELLHL